MLFSRAALGLALATFLVTVDAKDVTCTKGKKTTKVTLNEGDSFSFDHSGSNYAGKQKCKVNYKLGTCTSASVSCDVFDLNAKSNCKGDFISLASKGTTAQKFCQTNGPEDVTFTKAFSVLFKSNKKKSGSFSCDVSCTSGPGVTTEGPATTGGTADDIISSYEINGGGSNPWHYVTITSKGGGMYTWTNKAEVSWTLTYTGLSSEGFVTYAVGEDCPYFTEGYISAKLITTSSSKAIEGPFQEMYEKATGDVEEPCADGRCTILTEWGSQEVNPHIIRGIFAIWWDPKFDHTADAEELARKLNMVRVDCIGNLDMADPPNPGRGNYYNVYIHHNADDSYPSGWAQGQGTDKFRNPFLTFPYGLVPNAPSILHEGYHVFQYNANSFPYSGDNQWYTESSAQWYMSTYDTNRDTGTFNTAGSIVANPQLALWHSFGNEAPEDPNHADGREGWMYGVRQYAMHTFLYFATNFCQVDGSYLTRGFYAFTPLSPQEYMFDNVGHDKFRKCFTDWAAQNTAEMAYLTRAQYERGLLEITLAGTWDLYRPYVWETVDQGTEGQWIEPPQELRPRGWAYNAIRVNNTMSATYMFQLEGSAAGSQGGEAFFVGKVVVQSNNAEPKYYDMDMTDALTGEATVVVDAADYEVALVVASVPNNFGSYQNYQYKAKITRS